MKFSKLFVVFINSYLIQFCLCKFITSSFEISKFLETEKKIISSLNAYFERQQRKGINFDSDVLEFVSVTERQNNMTTQDMKTNENPLSVFYLLSRAVKDWSEVTKNLSCNEEQHDECPILTGADVINVVKRRTNSDWPTETELKEAARAIVNVWIVYDLNLDQVINGTIGDVSERSLSPDEIFFIANAARDSGMTYEAITWFEYLLQRLESFSSQTFKTSSLYRRLALTYREKGMLSKAIDLLQDYLQKDADDFGAARDLDYLKTSDANNDVNKLTRFAPNDTSKHTNSRRQYEELCRSSLEGLGYSNNLQCSLVPLYNCYGQVKVETVSKRPKIQIFYDVMDENQTKEIISYGEKSFSQFYEMFPFTSKPSLPDLRRISGPMCEWNPDYPLVTNLTRRLEQMTRYHMFPLGGVTSSECYMMTNEAPGLIHAPRVDFWPPDQHPYRNAGNRVATIMLQVNDIFYKIKENKKNGKRHETRFSTAFKQLSDVKYGGSVVFPKLNLTVPVRKGSAVIWSNLKEDGKPSARSMHTSCPVMIGSQWALYKNILYSNQVFRRPCEAL